jgi:hypothetical protein
MPTLTPLASPASSRSTQRADLIWLRALKQLDFLRDEEVVLTFDDGPWPVNTPSVPKKTLSTNAPRRSLFPIESMRPIIPKSSSRSRRQVTPIGAHTWSHANPTRNSRSSRPRKKSKKGSAR